MPLRLLRSIRPQEHVLHSSLLTVSKDLDQPDISSYFILFFPPYKSNPTASAPLTLATATTAIIQHELRTRHIFLLCYPQ